MSPEYQIGALWVEGPLSFLEQLCLKSFVDAGHHTILYKYGDVTNIPDGIEVRDANEVLPQTGFLTHERTGSPALHSDLFRYKMLEKGDRIIWADTDAYCVKAFETPNGHFYAWESKRHVNGGVLGLPPDSETLRELLEFTSDEFAIPPWYDDERKAEYEAAAARGEPVHAGEMTWGVWGPHAVTHFLQKTGEIKYALPRHALYPFTFKERRKMLKRETKMEDYVFDDTYSIHFYGRRMRKRIAEAEGGRPRRWSPIGRLMKKHGIVAEDGIIPGSPLEAEVAANPPPAPKVVKEADISKLADDKILVLSTMKNEGPFILDWIGYCQSIGVDHFLVYTNDCDDTTVEILERLGEMGIVTRVENPFDREAQERPQRAALADAAKQPVLQNADWIIPIDVDEYINIHVGDGTLRGLLAATDNPDLLAMTWRFFGCGGVVEYQDKPVAEQFVRAAPEFTRKPHHNWGFKTIMSNRVKYGKLGVHRPLQFPDQPVRWVNGSGEEMPERYRENGWRSSMSSWGYEMVTLNHYATRSIDSFLVKRDRGRVNHVNRDQGLEYWSVFNRNDMFDRTILPAVERAQPFVDALRGDKALGKLHDQAVAWHRDKIDELKERPEFLALYEELSVDPLTHVFDLQTPDGETVKFDKPPESVLKTAPAPKAAPDKTAENRKRAKAEKASKSAAALTGPTTAPDNPVTAEQHPILVGAAAEAGYQELVTRNAEKFPMLSAPTVQLSNDNVVIISSMKNEGPYILEWIAYHQSIGVKSFLVYTNDCSDGTNEILDRLGEMGIVQRLDNPFKRDKGQKPQRGALNDAWEQPIAKTADWVLISDVDEFVNIHVGDGRMSDMIKTCNGPNVISLTWKFFGNGGIHEFEDKFITEQFLRAAPQFIPKPRLGWGFKTMMHSSAPFGKFGVHRPLAYDEARADEVRWVNGSGRRMPDFALDGNTWRSTKRSIGYDVATLNHYVLRSAESFLIKRERGRINHVDEDQGVEYWARRNYATEVDDRIVSRLAPAREMFNDLMADETLGALHRNAVKWHKDRIALLKGNPEYLALYERITAPDQMDAVYYQKDAVKSDEG
ncbi:MAG: glycosyltransferase family 2 protein [Pikeienuella sp.]